MNKQNIRCDFLIFGAYGWIGNMLCDLLLERGESFYGSKVRIENRQEVEEEILKYKPRYVINAAGKTGKPNVDWCENNKSETIRSNVLGPLVLADLCLKHNLHLTNLASGCIYNSPSHDLLTRSYTEDDKPNFTGSFYSYTKVMAEELLSNYPNVLTLRLRMPISDSLSPRSLVTKITKYRKICSLPNSMTVLPDLLPLIIDMCKRNLLGVYNFVNTGHIEANEILALYKEIIDPSFTWENFTLEEQAKVLGAPRSNCILDNSKLRKLYAVPNIKESVRNCLLRIKQDM